MISICRLYNTSIPFFHFQPRDTKRSDKKNTNKKRFVPDTVVYPGNTEKWNIFFFVFFFFKFLFIASGSGGPLAHSLAYSQLEEPNRRGRGEKNNRNRKPLPDRRMELP